VQALSRKDKKTKMVKQEEENAAKAKKRAQREAKRIAAELIAKAKKDEENAQQLAKQVRYYHTIPKSKNKLSCVELS
jgi:regulator of protease activity HflC (stomatin/prohibitin superfamily)